MGSVIHFGAFDLPNMGDRLYAVLLPKLTGETYTVAGLSAAKVPDFEVAAIDSLSGPVIVGGGDLFATTAEYMGFCGVPNWPRSLGDGFRMKREAVYISVGVPAKTSNRPLGWIWTRDFNSAFALPSKPDMIAPDLAVLTSAAFPIEKMESDVCIVQTAYPNHETAAAVRKLQKRYRVRLISLTQYNGDYAAMTQFAAACGLGVEVIESVPEMLHAIANASLVVASSMHANIVAFSYGIPHLIAPAPGMTKLSGFLDIVGLPQHLALKSWAELDPQNAWVESTLLQRAQEWTEIALTTSLAHLAEYRQRVAP